MALTRKVAYTPHLLLKGTLLGTKLLTRYSNEIIINNDNTT